MQDVRRQISAVSVGFPWPLEYPHGREAEQAAVPIFYHLGVAVDRPDRVITCYMDDETNDCSDRTSD
jgi:hypothetical protein